ncbi:hypothetical protein Q3G72_034291 [Acer saccharum]|nr:hypothetical protein Q3G72_034291 [Acer saccharum]
MVTCRARLLQRQKPQQYCNDSCSDVLKMIVALNLKEDEENRCPYHGRNIRKKTGVMACAVPDAAFGAPQSDAGSQQNNIADGPVEKGNRYIDMENLVMGKNVQVPVPVPAPAPQFNIHHMLHRLKVGRP